MTKPRRPGPGVIRVSSYSSQNPNSSSKLRGLSYRRYGSTAQNEDMRKNDIPEGEEDAEQAPKVEDDPELEDLSLYEQKAVLVNREIDRLGMGRYQWAVFYLCGCGYMLDLLWAQAFGLIVSSIQQEFGFSDSQLGNIFSALSVGLTAGAFIWGFLVDIVGRYWAFNFTVLLSSIFGLVVGTPNSYNTMIVLVTFLGVGIGGNIPTDTTIVLECLPTNRKWLLPALSVFQPIGVVICSGICYAIIPNYSCAEDLKSCNSSSLEPGAPCCTKADNMGWRYVLYTSGGITLLVFILRFAVFRFQESPKFLLYRGKDEEAVQSLQNIAKFNKQTTRITLATFSDLTDKSQRPASDADGERDAMLGSDDEPQARTMKQKAADEWERYKLMFSSPTVIRMVVLLWLIYAFDYWGFTIAGSFLPTILKQKGKDLGLTTEQTYRSYIIIYLFGIPGVLLGSSIYGYKRVSMFISSALFGASLFAFTAVSSSATYIGINGLVYFFQSMFNALLYGTTPEFFPAPIRGTASGVSSFWGRLSSIVAPLAAQAVLAHSLNGVLYLAGSGVFVCTILILFLPMEGQTY